MLNSQILEVAIGLVFVYLLFSLICSMANEWISRVLLQLRTSTLADGIHSLINDPALLYNFYRHPLINALAKQPQPPTVDPAKLKALKLDAIKDKLNLGSQPSYIPGRTFALALLDLLAPAPAAAPAAPSVLPAAPAPAAVDDLARIQDKISQLPDAQYKWIKQALLPLLHAAPNMENAYKNIEN
jgi:hypothetical protein